MRILKFSQPNCDSCELLTNMIEDREGEIQVYQDEDDFPVKARGIYEINVFDHLDVAMHYGIRVTPTLVVENMWGDVKARMIGVPKSGNELDNFLFDAEDLYKR